jgi:GT2 family glycosyltransferase
MEFTNPHPYPIQIKGPDGKSIHFKKFEKKKLGKWFLRYHPRYLKAGAEETNLNSRSIKSKVPATTVKSKRLKPGRRTIKRIRDAEINKKIREDQQNRGGIKKDLRVKSSKRPKVVRNNTFIRKVVGTRRFKSPKDSTQHLHQLLDLVEVPISNDIGVGILSYNRLGCIQRLIKSIRKFTDLSKTKIIVSDESTDRAVRAWLNKQTDVVILLNEKRIGIAGQTNRLMRCLERFKYKIILNDDVEIRRKGWEHLYVNAMQETEYHHFCMRMPGVYGAAADEGVTKNYKKCSVNTITKKPHGAVIAFDDAAFKKVGYFDEGFGIYGIEHVEWSDRVSRSKIQPAGYHDVRGSANFFTIHAEKSAINTSTRLQSLKEAKDKMLSMPKRAYVKPTDASKVPGVTYIIPFQVNDRASAIQTVINNVKAQDYPCIEIIGVEQDTKSSKEKLALGPIIYKQAKPNKQGDQFNKSLAFNTGIKSASNELLILHDADMIVQSDYTKRVVNSMKGFESCHICQYVAYLNKTSTKMAVKSGIINKRIKSEGTVNYFEGGSLAINRKEYFRIGGFDESFVGYGCEDCEFYERMEAMTKFNSNRHITLIHLWHGRTKGWEGRHEANKRYHGHLRSLSWNDRSTALVKKLRSKGYKSIFGGYGL